MEPTIEDGILVAQGFNTGAPVYINASSILAIEDRGDSCWVYAGVALMIRGSAATVRALVWPRSASPLVVLGPWEQDGEEWVRRLDDLPANLARVHEVYHGCWSWQSGLDHGTLSTLEEAKAEADAALTSHGWALS